MVKKTREPEWVCPPLTRLNESAHKPEVCSDRVSYMVSTNKGVPSCMNEVDLLALAEFFPWPKGVTLCLPCADGGSRAKYEDCIVMYEESMKAGFRLPLHPFISKFISGVNLCPSHFSPNSWRCILAFLLKCKELGLVPQLGAFTRMHNIKVIKPGSFIYDIFFPEVHLISNPVYNDNLWENRWFLVRQSTEFCFDFPKYAVYCRKDTHYFKYEREIQEIVRTFKSLPRPILWRHARSPDYKDILDARHLEEAGLSLPHPITGPSNLVDLYEELITKRKEEAACPSAESGKIKHPSKKARTCTSQFIDLTSTNPREEVELAEVTRSINTLCQPEVSTALDRLSDIIKAAKYSEELQRQLVESRQEIVEFRREKAELVSKQSEELQHKLHESRQEIVELKREKAELISKLDVQQCEELWRQLNESRQENVEAKGREMELLNILAGKDREFQLRLGIISNRAMQDSDKLQWQINESRVENVELKRKEMKLVDEHARKETEFEERLKGMELEKIDVEEELKQMQANLKQLIKEKS